MPARATGLSMTEVKIGALGASSDMLTELVGYNWVTDGDTEAYTLIKGTDEDNYLTGQLSAFSASMIFNDAVYGRRSNLSLSAWSAGGTSYLGDITDFSLNMSIETGQGKGLASRFHHSAPIRRTHSMNGSLQVPTSGGGLLSLMSASDIFTLEDLYMDTVINDGVNSITLPMVMKSTQHTVQNRELQVENVRFERALGSGTMTGTDTLLTLAMAGNCWAEAQINTGVNQYGTTADKLTCLIVGASVGYANSRIIKYDFDFHVIGKPKVTSS